MTDNVIDLRAWLMKKPPKILGLRRGFTVADIAFLSHVWRCQGYENPITPRKGEKAAAERLRRAGLLHQHGGREHKGYLLTGAGQDVLEKLVGELARDVENNP